jgi:hypothetical protein
VISVSSLSSEFLNFCAPDRLMYVGSMGYVSHLCPLPFEETAEGFEREWEGMQLQRKGDELVLHLSLDIPAQVWSLLLNGGSVQGDTGWSFPSCAS